jgi:hypothetical protein
MHSCQVVDVRVPRALIGEKLRQLPVRSRRRETVPSKPGGETVSGIPGIRESRRPRVEPLPRESQVPQIFRHSVAKLLVCKKPNFPPQLLHQFGASPVVVPCPELAEFDELSSQFAHELSLGLPAFMPASE